MTAASAEKQVSRYALSDLAIRAAIALERFSLGESLDRDVVAKFAKALSDTSRADRLDDQARYFAVGYHTPYMKLARYGAGGAASVDAAQELLSSKAKSIRAFLEHPTQGEVGDLASFCTDLHHELAQSQLAEIRLAKRHRLRSEINRLPPRLRA